MSPRDTPALMETFLGPPSSEAHARVRATSAAQMSARLSQLFLASEVIEELLEHWDDIRCSPQWSSLLAALVTNVERGRGALDAPLGIWADLDDQGPCGRLLYYYLFALQIEELLNWYASHHVPADVCSATVGALARHGETHLIKHATTGVDAGWWMVPILRGEILQVQSLKFHRVHLAVGPLSPQPWLDDDEAQQRGEGFRRGDESLGVHIPARTDLSPSALDATFARAHEVLGEVWPCRHRRVATCQSWMLDERLVAALGEDSRIVGFQRRFELIAPFAEDVDIVKYFVFASEEPEVSRLKVTSRLQRVVFDVLSSGSWHNRTGWCDLKG